MPRLLPKGADARAMVTGQERKILRELSAIYVVFGLIAIGVCSMASPATWNPQWITASVAVIAAVVAAVGIGIQWWLAHKRAAIDLFLKTETDKHLLDAYDESYAGVAQMNTMAIHRQRSLIEGLTGQRPRPFRTQETASMSIAAHLAELERRHRTWKRK